MDKEKATQYFENDIKEDICKFKEIKASKWSEIYFLKTKTNSYYIKKPLGEFKRELEILALFKEMDNKMLIKPINIYNNYILLEDYKETYNQKYGKNLDFIKWGNMLNKYGKAQRQLETYIDKLSTLEIVNLNYYFDSYNYFIKNYDLTDEQIKLLINYENKYKEIVYQLNNYNIPKTIQHADLHTGNIFINNIIFDWGDARIAIPFHDLLVSLNNYVYNNKITKTQYYEIINNYLTSWSNLYSNKTLFYLAELAIVAETFNNLKLLLKAEINNPKYYNYLINNYLYNIKLIDLK